MGGTETNYFDNWFSSFWWCWKTLRLITLMTKTIKHFIIFDDKNRINGNINYRNHNDDISSDDDYSDNDSNNVANHGRNNISWK